MSTLSIHDDKGIFSRIRNSPFFLLPLILIGGYALASLSYTLIMENDVPAESAHVTSKLTQTELNLEAAEPNQVNSALAELKPDNPDQITSDVNVGTSDIYVLNSKSTRDYFASSGGDYDLILNQWRYYFQGRGIKYRDVQESDIVAGLKPGVLVLPSAVALSATERTAIDVFEKKGGSVLATWATGARSSSTAWAGYGFLQDQFDINVSGEIAQQDKEKFLVVSGETPVSYTLSAGTEIWMGLDEIHERPLRISGGEHAAGRFTDAVRTPENGVANESVVYTEQGASRRVYFAFSESSWRYEQANIYRLLDDVFNWLERHPSAYLANWPYPYRAAQILEMDTEDGYPNAKNFADLLNANGFQGTFYSLTSVAVKYPDMVRELELRHEIAYHADVHDGFKGQSREEQSRRLDEMRRELTPVVKNPAGLRGFRPPYELSDQITESLLYEKGFGHILANSFNTQGMLPFISLSSPRDFRTGLIVLPRTQRDDMNFAKDKLGSQEMTRVMIEDFDQAREFGALGVLSVHSQTFAEGSPVATATAGFLTYIKSSGDKTWVAPSGKVEAWWRNRALLKSELTGEAKNVLLNVTVEKPGLHWRSAIVISNPVRGLQPKLRMMKAGMPQPLIVPLDDYRTALVFNDLDAGQYSYHLSY